ncbi:hypothetical protein GVM20_15635 [Porphyrobacter sp. SLTP]|uniref:hypothetical protein n=1 Tax=Porphyrobacter sp. SLTP TaxID=2683266 RepID=UPI001411DB7F|nr:hypothetical protein [Porphyrobacter sp. SLTP]NBB26564.1 hypothetical protein [Porphyrobacter sp. SLTP]
MESWVWAAALIALAWFVFLRRDGAPTERGSDARPAIPDLIKWAKSKASNLEPTEKAEVDRAVQERKRLEGEARQATVADVEASKAIRQKIARANKIVAEAGLGKDLADLWEMVRPWPSWAKRQTGWEAPDGFSEIAGSENSAIEDSVSQWSWGGRRYELRYVRKQSFSPDPDWNPRDIHLSVDGEEVAVLNYDQAYHDYGSSLRHIGVDALTVGPWMADIVRMVGRLRQEQEARYRKSTADLDAEKAARLNL